MLVLFLTLPTRRPISNRRLWVVCKALHGDPFSTYGAAHWQLGKFHWGDSGVNLAVL